jgi:zinc transport system substrate-binding protein
MRHASFAVVFLALSQTSQALADVPSVVADFGPTHALVSLVMGDLGQPKLLLPPGADPHDFQMKPSQAQALADADLIFWVGPELIPSLQPALQTLGDGATSVSLLTMGGAPTRPFTEGGIDPHAWLDPAIAALWVDRIAADLATMDPKHADAYRANAAAATANLQRLDADLDAMLSPVRDRPFVVFHDALGYFADHYGLTVAGAIELGDASDPGARQLAEIRDILSRTGAVCIFPETGRDPKYIATLAEGLPVRIGMEQDVEALTLDPGPGQYEALLRGLATTLADCLKP